MEDSCYICGRTKADLDRLNEETRTRVYLSYFSNARGQIDEQRQKITFLQRLKDEESGDPHFRINAQQIFADPMAYKKLMPWIDTLMGIAETAGRRPDDKRTIGELVEELLVAERRLAAKLEEGLDRIRAGFATGKNQPLALERVTHAFPVDWSVEGSPFARPAEEQSDREPLRRPPGESKNLVDIPVNLCSICRRITEKS